MEDLSDDFTVGQFVMLKAMTCHAVCNINSDDNRVQIIIGKFAGVRIIESVCCCSMMEDVPAHPPPPEFHIGWGA
jgi:hypothetical protein